MSWLKLSKQALAEKREKEKEQAEQQAKEKKQATRKKWELVASLAQDSLDIWQRLQVDSILEQLANTDFFPEGSKLSGMMIHFKDGEGKPVYITNEDRKWQVAFGKYEGDSISEALSQSEHEPKDYKFGSISGRILHTYPFEQSKGSEHCIGHKTAVCFRLLLTMRSMAIRCGERYVSVPINELKGPKDLQARIDELIEAWIKDGCKLSYF